MAQVCFFSGKMLYSSKIISFCQEAMMLFINSSFFRSFHASSIPNFLSSSRFTSDRSSYTKSTIAQCSIINSSPSSSSQRSFISKAKSLQPGTTSLLLRLSLCDMNIDLVFIREWIHTWMANYIFSSMSTTTSVPLSLSTFGTCSIMIFYPSEQPQSISSSTCSIPRGFLSFNTTHFSLRSSSSILIRVSCISRFLNISGVFASSLPGERRIIRTLVSDIRREFFSKCHHIHVIYKAPYIRLRQDAHFKTKGTFHFSSSSTHIQSIPATVFVAEIRHSITGATVVQFIRNWAVGLQYGNISLLNKARLPPISTELLQQGVRIRIAPSSIIHQNEQQQNRQQSKQTYSTKQIVNNSVITATVREKSIFHRQQYCNNEHDEMINATETTKMSRKVLLLVSTSDSNELATQIILKSLTKVILRRFPNTRIHSTAF